MLFFFESILFFANPVIATKQCNSLLNQIIFLLTLYRHISFSKIRIQFNFFLATKGFIVGQQYFALLQLYPFIYHLFFNVIVGNKAHYQFNIQFYSLVICEWKGRKVHFVVGRATPGHLRGTGFAALCGRRNNKADRQRGVGGNAKRLLLELHFSSLRDEKKGQKV
jgi:hypothetical protein